jgi:succinate-semialdehyde dehydrogenase/glutarate-semialdehyde dehydrogenase
VEALAARVGKIEVGDGMREEFVVGPLVNQPGFNKVAALVDDARTHGARVVLGGKQHSLGGPFYEPTILADIGDDAAVAQTEIFGPVMPIYRFHTEGEVIKRANNSEYGLVAYAFTRDLGRAFRLSQEIESGMVILNSGSAGMASVPFGGVKHSGYGREGSYCGIEEYVEVKYVLMAGLTRKL